MVAVLESAAATEILFEPIELGPLTLRNRIVMAPMGTCLDQSGFITDATIAYYVRRARGGVGTITVEGCLVSADTVGPEPKICDERYLPGLTKLVQALKPYDVTVGVQLMHPGRQVVEGPVLAPSPIPLNSVSPIPHELTAGEISGIVEDYANAARLAQAAGFEFLEVHGAHGYLPSNFLSARDNQREDQYGGELAGRARFARELARAIVAAVGPELPLVWRINGDDGEGENFVIKEAAQVAAWLQQDGVAAFSVSSGTWRSLHLTLAPMSSPRGAMVPLARAIRDAVSVPVMAVGRLDDPELAARVILDGSADLICLGRGLIAEPDWPSKVMARQFDQVRPCIACNACVELVGRGEVARCSVNPEVGREGSWRITPATERKHVAIVGGGLAGLEAARIARLRGHDVDLFERDQQLGGKLEAAAAAPSKHEVLRFRDYQSRQVRELGAVIHTGVEADADTVSALAPDVALIAVGADPLLPPIPGLDSAHVHDAVLLLRGLVTATPGDRVVVVGGSATGCEAAEMLAQAGASVTIVEMRGSIGSGIESITRRQIVRTLKRAGVEILTHAKVVAVGPDAIVYEDAAGGSVTLAADVVCMALGWRSRGSALVAELSDRGVPVQTIGDANHPADFVAAINGGADAGLAL